MQGLATSSNDSVLVLTQLKQYLQTQSQIAEEDRQQALSAAYSHYWLHENADKIFALFFDQERIAARFQGKAQAGSQPIDLTAAEDLLNAGEELGPQEYRVSMALECVLDQIVSDIDLGIKQMFDEQHLKNQQLETNISSSLRFPAIEYAGNIFPDLNVFMLFTEALPQSAAEVAARVGERLLADLQSGRVQNDVSTYFKEAWPVYKNNIGQLMLKYQVLPLDLVQELCEGDEGSCYPAYKRKEIAKRTDFVTKHQ